MSIYPNVRNQRFMLAINYNSGVNIRKCVSLDFSRGRENLNQCFPLHIIIVTIIHLLLRQKLHLSKSYIVKACSSSCHMTLQNSMHRLDAA